MKRRKFVWLLLFVFGLSACRPIPDRINFSNDRRIFRGVYSGVGVSSPDAEKMPIRVEVSPQYIDGESYEISGTVTLNEETSAPFTGEASGGDTQLYILTEPYITPYFEAEFTYKDERWALYGSPIREDGYGPGQVPWYISFGPFVDSYTSPIYQATLKPTD